MYNTVIFDLDGTLLNTIEDLCNSVNYALQVNNLPKRSLEEVRRFVGNGIRKLIERAVPAGSKDAVIDSVYEDFKKHYAAHCNDLTAPYPGIMELLYELKKRGIKMGITSNKAHFAVAELNEVCFAGLIDEARGVKEGEPTKPDSFIIKEVLKALGADREHTLYVGDSQVDVATAANAELDMVTVLWGFRDYEELCEAGATKFIKEPSELLKYLCED